jgi:hypothetical protein
VGADVVQLSCVVSVCFPRMLMKGLTSGASGAGSSVLVASQAGIVLRTDAEEHVLELQTFGSWQRTLGHESFELSKVLLVAGGSVHLLARKSKTIDGPSQEGESRGGSCECEVHGDRN